MKSNGYRSFTYTYMCEYIAAETRNKYIYMGGFRRASRGYLAMPEAPGRGLLSLRRSKTYFIERVAISIVLKLELCRMEWAESPMVYFLPGSRKGWTADVSTFFCRPFSIYWIPRWWRRLKRESDGSLEPTNRPIHNYIGAVFSSTTLMKRTIPAQKMC